MNIIKTELPGVLILEPNIFEDGRGWFMETYSKKTLEVLNTDFVQDNESYSKFKGTLRGIHFQKNPYAQAKLVRCLAGSVRDYIIDLRKDSITYKQWVDVILSEENKKMIFIPRGFGHAFITLTDNVKFSYKVDNYYNKESDRSVRYDDAELNIKWEIENPIISKKDLMAPFLKESDCDF
ncbi:MAG: dTDP-4-dehydrorhamnose 3,5-epimerase [Anaerovorax sp.]|nr:dTDP-4-dehydrorhamnose 3,5-epimerase [Anaerovorax sp.]